MLDYGILVKRIQRHNCGNLQAIVLSNSLTKTPMISSETMGCYLNSELQNTANAIIDL
jgi:hypothetical protein